MTEAYTTLNNTMRYYGRIKDGQITENGAQIPFNFQLMDLSKTSSNEDFEKLINEFLVNMPKGDKIQANWVVRSKFSKYGKNKFF